MKLINCPICKNERFYFVASLKGTVSRVETYYLVSCKSCGHYYTRIPREVDFYEKYKSGSYKLIDNNDSLFSKILTYEYRNIVASIVKRNIGIKSLLDFGSGKGGFLFVSRKKGLEVKGVETSVDRARYAISKYDLDISMETYVKGKIFSNTFDVITLFHVLEHLPNPCYLLKKLILSNLDEKGLVVIEVPCYESLQSKIAGNNWIHLDAPLHLSHFTSKSLNIVLARSGLRVVKVEYFSIHNGVLGMVQSIMSIFGYKGMLIDDLKSRRRKKLLLSVIFSFPFAVIAEIFAATIKRGGVIRVFCKKA